MSKLERQAAILGDWVSRLYQGLAASLTRPRPLRWHLLALALASIVPMVAFSATLIWQLKKREEVQFAERLQQVAANLAADIDRQLVNILAIGRTLATSQMIQLGEFDRFHDQAIRSVAGLRLAVILAQPDGQQLLNTRVDYGTELPKIGDLPTLAKVVADKQSHVSNLFIGNLTNSPQLNVHVPVLRDGVLIYDLIIAFSPDIIRDISSQQFLPTGWLVGVSDANARIITRTAEHDQYVNKQLPPSIATRASEPSAYATTRLDGVAVLRAVAPVRTAEWIAAATVERSAVTAPLRDAIAALIIIGLLLVTAIVMVVSWLARAINRNLRDVRIAADALADGRLPQTSDGIVEELNAVRRGVAAAAKRRRAHEQERDLLLRELNHRVKNAFAVLQSIVNATLRHSTDPAEFAEAFKGRLHSMAAAQEILTSRDWTNADIEALAKGQLGAYLGNPSSRLTMSGPPVELPIEAAVPVGLVLHELGTNATKYGALSVPGGKVQLSWRIDRTVEPHELEIIWRERDGPPVRQPARRGFGSTLIERGLPRGTVTRTFDTAGVTCTVRLPLAPAVNPSAPPS